MTVRGAAGSLTPADALAALDRIKREAREAAQQDLAERVAIALEMMPMTGQVWPDTTTGKIAAILALRKEGQSNG